MGFLSRGRKHAVSCLYPFNPKNHTHPSPPQKKQFWFFLVCHRPLPLTLPVFGGNLLYVASAFPPKTWAIIYKSVPKFNQKNGCFRVHSRRVCVCDVLVWRITHVSRTKVSRFVRPPELVEFPHTRVVQGNTNGSVNGLPSPSFCFTRAKNKPKPIRLFVPCVRPPLFGQVWCLSPHGTVVLVRCLGEKGMRTFNRSKTTHIPPSSFPFPLSIVTHTSRASVVVRATMCLFHTAPLLFRLSVV